MENVEIFKGKLKGFKLKIEDWYCMMNFFEVCLWEFDLCYFLLC